MNSSSQEIKLLLNEIAILSQPQQIDGKLIYQKDTLKKLRSLAAKLYILCDFGLEGNLEFEALMADIEKRYQQNIPKDAAPNPVVVPVAEPVAVEKIETTAPEVIAVEKKEEAPVVFTPPIAETPVVQPIQETPPPPPVVQAPPVVEVPPVVEAPKPVEVIPVNVEKTSKGKFAADKIVSGINLSRRFEFINFLFGGNAGGFNEFIQKLAGVETYDEMMEIFEKNFAEKGWSKKPETASDLKKIIKNLYEED